MAPSKSKFPRVDPVEEGPKVFEIDTSGSASIRHSVLHGAFAPRARKGVQKTLRVDEILGQTKIDGTTAQHGRVRGLTSSSQKVKILTSAERKRLERMVIRRGHGSGIATIDLEKRNGTTSAIKPPPAPADDIWNCSSSTATAAESALPQVKAPPMLRKNEVMERVSKMLPVAGLTPVPLPHPGQSYNPTLKDHQSILGSTLEKLEEEQRELDRISRLKDSIISSMESNTVRNPWERFEDEVDDGEEEPEGEVDIEKSQNENLDIPCKKKAPKKKTIAQRKRKARALEEARLLAKKKQAKVLAHSINEIPRIFKGITAAKVESEKERQDRGARRASLVAQYGLSAARGGKPKGVNSILYKHEYQLTEDLTEAGLRCLKPEGNLWRDWSQSNIRRGKLESRPKIGLVKGQRFEKGRKFKEVEKHGWKNFEA
ncbi:ribosome biogenesis protein Nop53/GLTSCR2 [Phakopsora pachyrhizi]|uniref:Ribosome biogenesis protein NOP53 n=1 Tax=Phakopsora pachyrhizi TaxID=170000 RepID=A0AAV0BIT9_PHAPC|nr:ribosome biogenesis protein Nop53/GLTSCR2 [Phakopsora pachyrhizi]CAH7686490.1 ribosome biogenesis protein Nop53/GLTSCR2 [Phakopsora pachyrhizi]